MSAVLLTHAHFDHIGAVDDVANEFDAKVYVHREEKSWLTDTEKNGSKNLQCISYHKWFNILFHK